MLVWVLAFMLSCVPVMVSAVSECVSDCIVIMMSVRTVMTVLACVYSVMVILRWRERFSNPFKHDSAHEFNSYHSYQGIRSE